MNELSKEKTMTVNEVSDILKVDVRTIQRYAKELFPEIVKHGSTTRLNEIQVTKIKLELTKNYSIDSDSVVAVKTKLEKALLIQQAMQFQQEIINEQQAEIEILKPKAIAFDVLMKTDDMMSITDAAKHFNMSQKVVFVLLRSNGYLTLSSLPTQKAIDKDILTLKETVCKDNKTRAQAVVKMCQLNNFYNAVKLL
jgi:phage antirepressor YoqD-like protein